MDNVSQYKVFRTQAHRDMSQEELSRTVLEDATYLYKRIEGIDTLKKLSINKLILAISQEFVIVEEVRDSEVIGIALMSVSRYWIDDALEARVHLLLCPEIMNGKPRKEMLSFLCEIAKAMQCDVMIYSKVNDEPLESNESSYSSIHRRLR